MLEPIEWASPEQHREVVLQTYLHQIMVGTQKGLSEFYQRDVRVAVILGLQHGATADQLKVYDLHGLLDDWKPFISKKFAGERQVEPTDQAHSTFQEITVARIPERSIVLEFTSARGIYQFWMIDVPVQNGSYTIADEWARYAGRQLHNERLFEAAPVNIEFVIPSLGTAMVRLAIMQQIFGQNRQFEVERLVEALLRICAMTEEGKLSSGRISICDKEVEPSIPFQHPVDVFQAKHVRKLLNLSGEASPLVCVGTSVKGLCTNLDELPTNRLDVVFKSGNAVLELAGKPLCRIYRDRFRCALIRVDRFFLKQFIPVDFPNRESLAAHVADMADRARGKGFGCTIVLDLDGSCEHLTGQDLVNPLPLGVENKSVIESMCGIDGAILVEGKTQTVKSFGCLLDGPAVPNEDRSRGARHTSALRFSAQHPSIVIFVVSEDGPLSAFQNGIKFQETLSMKPTTTVHNDAPTVSEWLNGKRSALMNSYS